MATTTVVTVSVVALEDGPVPPTLRVDAHLSDLAPAWSETRLVGRVSTAPERRFTVRDADGADLAGVALILPGDIRVGDLLTVPCPGAHSVGEVR